MSVVTVSSEPAESVLEEDVLRVAALQMSSSSKVFENLRVAERLIGEAASLGAEIIVLPESFAQITDDHNERLAAKEFDPCEVPEKPIGPIQSFLMEQSRLHQIYLVGGTISIVNPQREDKVMNTCFVYNPMGNRIGRYDKIHLFRLHDPVALDGVSSSTLDESANISPGRTPVTVDIKPMCSDKTSAPVASQQETKMAAKRSWRMGLSICYDLRFPELYRIQAPVDLIIVPSAFLFATGKDHWEVLLRARAIENQCYVLAPAQSGSHKGGRRTWGHSMLIDPWGKILAVKEEGEGLVFGFLSRARLCSVRELLPALSHRLL